MNLLPTSSLPVARPPLPTPPFSNPRYKKSYIIAGIIGLSTLLVLASLYSVYLGAKVAPGKKFKILGPSTLQAGQTTTISWDASPENVKKYPFEKIEYCSGNILKPKCVLLAAAAPNKGQAVVKVPATIPTGTGHFKFTARDPSRKLLGSFSTTSGTIKVQPATTEVVESEGGGGGGGDGGSGGGGGGGDSGDGSGTNENQPTPTTPANSSPQTVHIVNATNKGLEYITNKSGAWQTTTIDPKGTHTGPRMPEKPVIDKEGNVHVVYSEKFEYGPIKYANNANGQWHTEVVVNRKNEIQKMGNSKSLAVDDKGKTHISYVTFQENLVRGESNLAYLNYATNASGSWVTETVDKVPEGGLVHSKNIINIDKNGKAHIVYLAPPNGCSKNDFCLKYATNISGSWVVTTIDNIRLASGYRSYDYLVGVLDSHGNLHLVYYGADPVLNGSPAIKYASNDSGKWIINTLDYVPWYNHSGQWLGLALDSNNKAHVSYVHSIKDDSVEINIASNSSGAWKGRTLDQLHNFNTDWSSMNIDAKETVYAIGYSGNYAVNINGQWITEKLGNIGFANLSSER